MAPEKALALVLRTTDWSETSKIATLWTREFGKVRVLAKGGRRLKSNFESALDLLTVCGIVLLRKTSGGLDLLTEARVVQRFANLRCELAAYYAGCYVAELLSDLTNDYDPHPVLFDEAVEALRTVGTTEVGTGTRVARFEITLLRELGYLPTLERCANCGGQLSETGLVFSGTAGGVLCGECQHGSRDRQPLSAGAWHVLRALAEPGTAWTQPRDGAHRAEVRQLLGRYVTGILGRRPRLLPYLGS